MFAPAQPHSPVALLSPVFFTHLSVEIAVAFSTVKLAIEGGSNFAKSVVE